jgi:hypothetical protein
MPWAFCLDCFWAAISERLRRFAWIASGLNSN